MIAQGINFVNELLTQSKDWKRIRLHEKSVELTVPERIKHERRWKSPTMVQGKERNEESMKEMNEDKRKNETQNGRKKENKKGRRKKERIQRDTRKK